MTPRLRVRRWREPAAVDVALTAAFAVVAVVELHVSNSTIFEGSLADPWATAAALAVVAPLLWRRRRPFLTAVLVGLLMSVPPALLDGGILFWGALFPLLLAVYSGARYAQRPWDTLVLLAPALTVGLMPLWVPTFDIPGDYFFCAVLTVPSWLAGQGIRRWQQDSHRLSAALDELTAAQEQQAAAAAAEERTRIARELHDIIAHSMSVVVVQARSARLDVRESPERAEEAMRTVERVGRQSLLEMRRLLEVLRTDEEATLAPQPGLENLDELVDELSRAGLAVYTVVAGTPVRLPRPQDLSAYRIVQEALTNALKHGARGNADLRLTYGRERLEVCISNATSRRRRRPGRPGHGLIGIRERVALYGGRVDTRDDGDTFRVMVDLPFDGAEA
jgi:signal transduction histidine kinase